MHKLAAFRCMPFAFVSNMFIKFLNKVENSSIYPDSMIHYNDLSSHCVYSVYR